MKNHNYYVYIMANINRGTYIGVTNDVIRRVEQHKDQINESFTKKYKMKKVVYYEYFSDINSAIRREKELKGWRKEKKVKLIEIENPEWKDLYNELIGN